MELCGSRGAPYDRYPECWQNGKPAPNLETFAQDSDHLESAVFSCFLEDP